MQLLVIVLIGILVILTLVTIGVALLAITIFSGAPWVPTNKVVSRAMCDLADLKEGDRVMDLGCGDASILLVAAKEYGAVGYGVELNLLLVWFARLRARMMGVSDKVTVVRGNMFHVDLPDTDVAMLYLLPKATHRVEKRLRERYKHLKVISHGFKLEQEPVDQKNVARATVRKYQW